MTSMLLMSGGLDSTAIAAIHQPAAALFVDYGQRPAAGERRAARDVCGYLGLELHEVEVDLTALGAGLLSPRARPLSLAPSPEWYPYRNQLLVTIAGTQAIALGLEEMWIGLVAEDESRHGDGTRAFVRALDGLLRLQEGRVGLAAPGHSSSTAALLQRAGLPDWLLERTLSCHVSPLACGECPGCVKRIRALCQRTATEDWPTA